MKRIYFLIILVLTGFTRALSDELPRYLRKDLSYEERVEDLLRRMTLHEKVLQLQNRSTSDINAINDTYKGESYGSAHEMSLSAKDASILFRDIQQHMLHQTRLGIPILTTVEGLHGILQNGCTIFPQAIAQGATFNPELIQRMAEAEAEEARTIGIRQLLSPVLDIARELRWGRVEETFGEDPYLIAQMGIHFVKGAQSEGVGCMPKHFVAHGMPTGGLNCAYVPGGERELRNLYLYPFKRVIAEAHPAAIMSCYSAYDGVPVTGSSYFMTDILRDELGFDGFTYSDWGSVERLKTFHFSVPTTEDAARQALTAGIDMDVYDWAYQSLEEQVKKGILDEYYIDRACRRVLLAKFKAGLFDEPYGEPDKVEKVVHNKENVALAKQIADESIVLLKNENDLLPLDVSKYKKIALLGPNIDAGIAGDYGWQSKDERACVTLYEGLEKRIGKKVDIIKAEGCDWWSQNGSGIADAVACATESDLAIVAVGTRSLWLGRDAKSAKVTSGEGFDLSSLDLPGRQLDLLKAVKATGKPMIVVLITGKPLVMSWAAEHADAILVQFYGGEQQGLAMADVLTGEVCPSGRLNVSFPRSTGNTPCFYNYYPTDREQVFDKAGSYDEPGGHYIFEKPYALWPFGFGLSYADFKYEYCLLNDTVFSENGILKADVTVCNVGRCDGKEVIQLYVRDMISSVAVPVRQLKAFRKVFIPAGEKVTVQLELPVSELALYDEHLRHRVEPGTFEIRIGPSSDRAEFIRYIEVK